MRETTRMALRAATATAIAIVATRLLTLPRSYWAILVAVVLVGETWGDSVRLTIHRFGMTVLGGVAGALLQAVVAPYPGLEAALLFAGVWLAVYFRGVAGAGSYPWMIFFITVYIVFLFAILGRWSVRGILFVRIADTALGAVAALAASVLVRPRAARERLDVELRALWSACHALVAEACGGSGAVLDADEVVARGEALHERWRASAYESPFSGARRRTAALVEATEALGHASISLARALATTRERDLPVPIRDAIRAEKRRTLAALAALPGASRGDTTTRADRPGERAAEPAVVEVDDKVPPPPEDSERACPLLADERLGQDDFAVAGAVLAHAEDVRLHVATLREILGRP